MFDKLKNYSHSINGIENMNVASVIVPIIKIDNSYHILFELRAKTLNFQPLEVCLPGGRIEENETKLQAAIRETFEEIGISSDKIEVICELDTFVSPFNSVIYPFLCTIEDLSTLNINPQEVDHVFTVPIEFFKTTEPIVTENIIKIFPEKNFPHYLTSAKDKYEFNQGTYETIFYKYNNYVIWGLTARIINNLINILK